MAQTVNDVQTEILTEKANYSQLDALDSTSNTAIWRLWMWVTATIIVFFEEVMDLFKTDIQNIINNNQYGNDPWWYRQIMAFQFGDLLVFLNNVFQYAVIDATKQIIGFCSITSNGGIVQIKVAANVGGQPAVLTTDQVNGLIAYCQSIRPSGVRFTVQSLSADTLKFYLNVYYNASGDIATIQPAVEAAIANYLLNLNTVNFNGTLYLNKLVDAIQAVPGTTGNQVDIIQAAAKNGADAYANFTSSYQPKAGYFMIDPAYPLSATITYIPA